MMLSPIDTLVTLLAMAAAVQVVWHAVSAVNEMTRGTKLVIRLTHIAMATSAAAILLCPVFYRSAPGHSETALIISVALLTLFDRRTPTLS